MPYTTPNDAHTPPPDAHTPPNAADTQYSDAYTPSIDVETARAVLHLKEKWQEEIRGRLREVEAERDELREERDDLDRRYHDLASKMVYEGNSVQHWRLKAKAYKECAGAVSDLKQIVDAITPAEVVEAVQAMADSCANISRQHGELQEAIVFERDRADALAAHVERLEEAGEDLALEACSVSQASIEWSRVRNSAPKNSLARRDALMKAEGLDSAVRTALVKGQTSVAQWLEHLAGNCRRRADEDNHE